MTSRQHAILALTGGVVAAIGSALPWATATTGFGSISIAGTSGDGVITLIAGGLAALLGFWRYGGSAAPWAGFLIGLCGVVILAIGAIDYQNLQGRTSPGVLSSIGIGLYAVLAGGFLTLIGSWSGRRATP